MRSDTFQQMTVRLSTDPLPSSLGHLFMKDSDFLCSMINQPSFQDYIMQMQNGASRQALNFQQIRNFELPLPPVSTQRQIVAEIEVERALVESSRKLIEIFEKKVQAKLAEIWGNGKETSGGFDD